MFAEFWRESIDRIGHAAAANDAILVKTVAQIGTGEPAIVVNAATAVVVEKLCLYITKILNKIHHGR